MGTIKIILPVQNYPPRTILKIEIILPALFMTTKYPPMTIFKNKIILLGLYSKQKLSSQYKIFLPGLSYKISLSSDDVMRL